MAEGLEKLEDMIVRVAETTATHLQAAKTAIGAVIFGQDKVVEQALITVLSGGHGLLVGVPGLAKTKLVATMGVVLGLDARRIQFPPDLMPSDILGAEVLEESPGGKRGFRFISGPVFAQLLMADEINRASPRTQSARAGRHLSVAGSTTRPISHGSRCRLPRSGGGAQDSVRHHRCGRISRKAGDDRRRSAVGTAARAAPAGRRGGGG